MIKKKANLAGEFCFCTRQCARREAPTKSQIASSITRSRHASAHVTIALRAAELAAAQLCRRDIHCRLSARGSYLPVSTRLVKPHVTNEPRTSRARNTPFAFAHAGEAARRNARCDCGGAFISRSCAGRFVIIRWNLQSRDSTIFRNRSMFVMFVRKTVSSRKCVRNSTCSIETRRSMTCQLPQRRGTLSTETVVTV